MLLKKFSTVALAAVATVALFFALPASAEVPTGESVPSATFTDVDGVEHSLSDFAGKIVVLEWNNPECPFVKKFYKNGDLPKIQLQGLESGETDVVWIAVNSSAEGKQGYQESDDAAKALMEEQGFNVTTYIRDVNGELGNLFSARTTPHMFVIDADQTLAYQGAIDSIKSADPDDIAEAENYVLAALDSLQNGEAVEVTETQPYGCSVKY